MKSQAQKRTEAEERQSRYDALTRTEKFAQMKTRRGESLREWHRVMNEAR